MVRALSTSLSLSLPSTATTGKQVTVNATLQDESGSPIENATIDFHINVDGGWDKISSGTTNSQGIASIKYALDKAGVFQLRATYSGVAKYGGSEASATVTVATPEEAPPTAAIPYDFTSLVAIGVVIIGVVAALLAKRRSRKTRLEDA